MERSSAYRYLVWFWGCFAVATAAIVGVNWIVDPLQFYRKAAYPPLMSDQKRYQAPGLARNYDYDTVIVGTSMSMNITARQIRESLGTNGLNLSMQGASGQEQSLIAEVALRTGKVKCVIWELNCEFLAGEPTWVANYDGTFPYYFYDLNPYNEIHNYLLSLDTSKSTMKILLRRCGLNTYEVRQLDQLSGWYWNREFGMTGVQRGWRYAADRMQAFRARANDYAVSKLNRNVDLHVMRLIRENPQVQFILYFPPYSGAYYAYLKLAAPAIIGYMAENRRYVFTQAAALQNVQLYDFQTVPSIIFDYDHFCDLKHFDPRVDDYILASIRDRKQLLTGSGLSAFEAMMDDPRITAWISASGK